MEPGTTLAQYRVLEKIGSGGMGEVWLAEDTRLQRRVALKALTSTHALHDQVLRERFEREARSLAALNHPNIVTLYEVESDNGTDVLAMELVEGTPLSQSIRKPMPLDRFFHIAIQITDAIGAAHEKKVLHRDLKPDNVMLTANDTVKVLDFGLAKLRELPDGETLPGEGLSSGTTAYMSPEQAEGAALDAASDVFTLGILLYQMATGKHPFTGGSSLALLSSILKDDPARISELEPGLPTHLSRIVSRCLQKDRRRRYPTARELCTELRLLQEEVQSGQARTALPERTHGGRNAIVAAVVIGVVAIAAVVWLRPPAEEPASPQFLQQTFTAGVETRPSISPDGEMVVYTAGSEASGTDIFLQRVVGQKRIQLTGDSEVSESSPAFSPDGTHIAFRSTQGGGGIFIMGATGESVRRITDFGYDPAWSPDGERLVFATEQVDTPYRRYTRSELWVVNVDNGAPQRIFEGDAVHPSWSPDGERIAFWFSQLVGSRAGQRDIATIRPDGSDFIAVTQDLAVDWCPVWRPTNGTLLFCSNRSGSMNLWEIAVDTASGQVHGEPHPVTLPALWAGPVSVDATGHNIAYVSQEVRSSLRGIALDADSGKPFGTPVTLTEGTLIVWLFDPSPDGEWIAFANEGTQEDIYLVRRDGTGLRKLTDDPHKDRGVSWWNDDRLLFFSSRTGGYEIWSIRPDGSDLMQVTQTQGASLWLPRASPDGRFMLAHNSLGTRIFDLESGNLPLPVEEARHIGAIDGGDGVFAGYVWSPDGQRILGLVGTPPATTLVVFDLDSESFELFELPETDDVVPIGWLADGRRFLARASGQVWQVDSQSGAAIALPLHIGSGTASISRDGKELFYVELTTQADIWVAQFP